MLQKTTALCCLLVSFICFFAFESLCPWQVYGAEAAKPVRILLITGGHSYDRDGLHRMLSDMPDATFQEIVLPAEQNKLTPAITKQFDCLVFHDQSRFALSDRQKADLEAMWAAGMPTVMLHHSLISHNDVPLFRDVFGGAYLIKPAKIDGKDYPASNYTKPTDVTIQIIDKDHPITRGVSDFTINDEVFGNLYIAPGIHVLAQTNHPKSSKPVLWTNQYKKSRVFALVQGHDKTAFDNATYRTLLYRGIRWAVEK